MKWTGMMRLSLAFTAGTAMGAVLESAVGMGMNCPAGTDETAVVAIMAEATSILETTLMAVGPVLASVLAFLTLRGSSAAQGQGSGERGTGERGTGERGTGEREAGEREAGEHGPGTQRHGAGATGILLPSAVFILLGLSGYIAAWHLSGVETPADRQFGLSAAPICGFLDRHFHTPETNALLRALLCGDRSMLDAQTVTAFRKSGASHILALSGLHLGIIYSIVSKVLSVAGNSRAGWAVRAAISIGLCFIYMLMTGAGPSIVRAFLFISLNEIARLNPHRQRRPLNIWCTALTLQLTFNPLAITSVGFQLSYLAMLGIYLLYPVLEKWYPSESRYNPVKAIWNSAAMSVSCQLFTGPLAWLRFRALPVHFLLTNLIALPVTEALIVCAVAGQEKPCDTLARALVRSLEIIASM